MIGRWIDRYITWRTVAGFLTLAIIAWIITGLILIADGKIKV